LFGKNPRCNVDGSHREGLIVGDCLIVGHGLTDPLNGIDVLEQASKGFNGEGFLISYCEFTGSILNAA